jgi:hypothetical protein
MVPTKTHPPYSISILLVSTYTIALLLFLLSFSHSLGTGSSISVFFDEHSEGIHPKGKPFTVGLALAWCGAGAGTIAGVVGSLAGSVPARCYLRHWGIAMPISWMCSAFFIVCIAFEISWLALIAEFCAVLAASPAWYSVANVVVSHRSVYDSDTAIRVHLNRNFFLDLHSFRERAAFLYYYACFHVPTSMYFGIQLVVSLATIMATGSDMHVVDFNLNANGGSTNAYVATLLIALVLIIVFLTAALGVWKADVILQLTVTIALLSMLESKSQSPSLRMGILAGAGLLGGCSLVVAGGMVRSTLANRGRR